MDFSPLELFNALESSYFGGNIFVMLGFEVLLNDVSAGFSSFSFGCCYFSSTATLVFELDVFKMLFYNSGDS